MSLKLGSNDTAILAGSSVVKQMLLGTSPKFAAPVLDHVPGAAAAYSLRRLSNAYTGPVVRVRRSSDSTTADFTAAEVVDGTLTAWVGAGDGFVDTWYDQSGNARHATQATAGYQPKVVSSGVVVTEGGKAALSFDGVDDFLNSITSSLQPSTIAAVALATSSGTYPNGRVILGRTTTDAPVFWIEDQRLELLRWGTNYTGSLATDATQHVLFAAVDATNTMTHVDGANAVTNISGTFISGQLSIGRASGGAAQPFIGTISEIIIYPSDVSASRELAEGEIAWHYGLQAKLPYNHAYAPQALGGASQTVPTDSDAIAYLAAVAAADGAAVERSVAIAIDDFVKGLKADGLWSAIGSACVLAGARTVAGALVPLKGAAPTGYNWVASDYSRSLGLKGDGSTKYIDSNRANDADGQNDHHMAFYATQQSSVTAVACMGAGPTTTETGASNMGVPALATQTTFRSRNSASDNKTAACVGFVGASRADAAAFSARANGLAFAITRASQSPTADSVAVFASTGGAFPTDARLSFYSIGASVDLALLDTRVSALMSALGAAL